MTDLTHVEFRTPSGLPNSVGFWLIVAEVLKVGDTPIRQVLYPVYVYLYEGNFYYVRSAEYKSDDHVKNAAGMWYGKLQEFKISESSVHVG